MEFQPLTHQANTSPGISSSGGFKPLTTAPIVSTPKATATPSAISTSITGGSTKTPSILDNAGSELKTDIGKIKGFIVSLTAPKTPTAPAPKIPNLSVPQGKTVNLTTNPALPQPNFAPMTGVPSAQETITNDSLRKQAETVKKLDKFSNDVATTFPGTRQIFQDLSSNPLSLQKIDPKKIVTDMMTTISTANNQAKQKFNIQQQNLKTLGPNNIKTISSDVSSIVSAINLGLSPISAIFNGINDIPLAGTLGRIITLPFAFLGDAAPAVSNKLIDLSPLPKNVKEQIKPAIGEVAALVAQLSLGKGEVDKVTEGKLVDKYGPTDAKVLIDTAKGIVKDQPVEDITQRININGIDLKKESTPNEVIQSVIENNKENTPEGKALVKSAMEAQTQGQNLTIEEAPKTEGTSISEAKPTTVKSTDELLSYIDVQGFRTPEAIAKLRQDIIDNGIKYPVELIRNEDGTFQINDGTHRIQIAKDLGIKEIPTKIVEDRSIKGSDLSVKTQAQIKEEVKAPIEGAKLNQAGQEPIGTGRVKESQAYKRVFDRMTTEEQAAHPNEATYNVENLAHETEKALNLIAEDPHKATRIALGLEKAPPGYNETAISIGVADKAFREGNTDLARQAEISRSLRQTRRGQEIVAERGRFTENSPHYYMRELLDRRLTTLGTSVRQSLEEAARMGKSVKEAAVDKIDKEAAKLKQKLLKDQVKIKSAQDIIDALRC